MESFRSANSNVSIGPSSSYLETPNSIDMISLDPAYVCSKFVSNRACSTYPPNQLKIG